MVKHGTLKPICIGNFMATIGLACAHMMSDSKEATLSLHHTHSQWRIDNKSLISLGGGTEKSNYKD